MENLSSFVAMRSGFVGRSSRIEMSVEGRESGSSATVPEWRAPMSSKQAAGSRLASRRLLRQPFSHFDQDAPVGRILDFPEGDDEPQPFDNIQIDLIFPKQLQKLVAGMIGTFNVHNKSSKSE
jgi:hypothetical protein